MAEKREFWTEARLKKGIYWLIGGIVAVIIALAGWWYYLNVVPMQAASIITRSIDEAQKKSTQNPNDASLHLALAQLYMQNKQYDETLAELDIVIKLEKNNDVAYTIKGMAYEAKADDKKAEAAYKKAIEIGKTGSMQGVNRALFESYYKLGQMYYRQKKINAALDMMTKASQIDNIDADSLYWLGKIYYQKGDYNKAAENLVKATRFAPDFVEAEYLLGRSYEKLSRTSDAIKAYKQALAYKKDYQEAQTALDRLQK